MHVMHLATFKDQHLSRSQSFPSPISELLNLSADNILHDSADCIPHVERLRPWSGRDDLIA